MSIKSLLCLAILAALGTATKAEISYDGAVEVLAAYLEMSAYSDSPVENIRAIAAFNADNRDTDPHTGDVAEQDLFQLFGQLLVDQENLCKPANAQTIFSLNRILEGKACQDSVVAANRVEQVVHLVCKLWADDCNASSFDSAHLHLS